MTEMLEKLQAGHPHATAFVRERLPGLIWLASDRLIAEAGQTSGDPLFAWGGRILSYGSMANVAFGDKSMKYLTGPAILIGGGFLAASGIKADHIDMAKEVFGIGTDVAMLGLFYGHAMVDKIAHLRPAEKLLRRVSDVFPKLDGELFGELANGLINLSMVWEAGKLLVEGCKTGNLKELASSALLATGMAGYTLGNHRAAVQNREMREKADPVETAAPVNKLGFVNRAAGLAGPNAWYD